MLFAWPPRSPDATACDFVVLCYVKDHVYGPPFPASIPETITTGMLETVWNELDYRVDVCRIKKGAHIEHL
jgi:hypothetical protein